MKIRILILEDDTLVLHHSVSTVNDDINPLTAAINAIVNELTGAKSIEAKIPMAKGATTTSKFAEAVPDYIPEEKTEFHSDLVKAGIAKMSTPVIPVSKEIPIIKLDMKSILKGK